MKHQGGLPRTWNDTSSPAFAQGTGAAAPQQTTLSGSGSGAIQVLTFAANTEDRVFNGTQILHDIWVPSSGTVTFRPHVHFTFVAEPTTGQTVIWEWHYVVARPGVTAATAAAFASSPTVMTGTYTTTADVELRKHLITALGDVTLNASDCAPSMAFMGTLLLKSTSTITANQAGLLFFDIHYQQQPRGTVGEFT